MAVRAHDPGELFDPLQAVLTRYVDSSLGFDEAARLVDHGPVAVALAAMADLRAEQAAYIAASLEELGSHPDIVGSRPALIHRWWLDLRGRLAGSDPSAILDECRRGEAQLLRTIEQALAQHPDVPSYCAALASAARQVAATIAQLDELMLAAANSPDGEIHPPGHPPGHSEPGATQLPRPATTESGR